MKQITFLVLVFLCLFSEIAYPKDYDIVNFGAKSNGKVCTKAIQKAIDECTQNKGGRVVIPTGEFICGTLYLKNNVTLFLEKGATLFGSIDSVDYPLNIPKTVKCLDTHGPSGKPRRNFALIYAELQENIGIEGDGTINGNGNNPIWQRGDNGPNRPKLIFFISCKRVRVENVLLTNSVFWMQDYLGCDGVTIKGIKVINHGNWNNDGIDIDSKNVTVSDCIIDSDDDAICLKSYLKDRPCERVTISNCVVSSNCNAIKFGTPGYGGFKDILVNNCTIGAASQSLFRKWTERYERITTDPSMITGLSIECVDGGNTENIIVSNITMKATQTPIFIKVGNRRAKFKDEIDNRISTMKNIIISNITADVHSLRSCSISAYPNTQIENVKLSNIILNIISCGTESNRTVTVPENETAYPTPTMLGNLMPAYGFYLRHINNLNIRDLQINLTRPDGRSVIVLDDVNYANFENITIKNNLTNKTIRLGENEMQLHDTKDIFLNFTRISRD